MRPTPYQARGNREPLTTASGSPSTYHLWALEMSSCVILRPLVLGFGVNQGVPTTQIMAPNAIARNAYKKI
jgi:hypothetical protein